MNDLDAFLNEEANDVEMESVQWMIRLKYRKRELERQSSLIQVQSSSSATSSANDNDTDSLLMPRQHFENRIRLPQLDVPVFHGNYKDYPTFWTTFNYHYPQQPLSLAIRTSFFS